MKIFIATTVSLLFIISESFCQVINSYDDFGFSFSARVIVGLGDKNTSYYVLSLGLATYSHDFGMSNSEDLDENYKFYFSPAFQFNLNIYSNGLGEGLIKEYRKGQIDFVTTALLLAGANDPGDTRMSYIRPFHQNNSVPIQHPVDYLVWYGTSFIMNNHQRNQQIGNIGLNLFSNALTLGYYNDGGYAFLPPFFDEEDKYYTGGGYLSIGISRNQFIEIAYDRFTGDTQKEYVVSKELGFFGTPTANLEEIFYNQALFSVNYIDLRGSKFGVGTLGHTSFDFQDLLHKTLNLSRHLSLKNGGSIVFISSYEYNDNIR